MSRPTKLEPSVVDTWLKAHAEWQRSGEALVRVYKLPDFATALALVVHVGCWAEKHDHHPDVELGWGRVKLLWTTHDAGGVTQLDLDGAEASDGASA
jgi:4a-hydroxytetrahydrobiopterin dehydratase